MKTFIKPLLLVIALGVVTLSTAKPIIRPTVVASYKTGIYTTTDGSLRIALDKQTGGAVDILLKNASDKVIYSQHLTKSQSKFRTLLNLKTLPDGVYQIEITNGVETTKHTVTLSTQPPVTPSRLVAINQ